ncbi:MAG: BMC domain-containing protein [Myxococcota bacterium]
MTPIAREIWGPALGFLELESISRGMVVADALVKRAAVTIALAEPTTPGKYVLLFFGGVGEVQESFAAGVESAGSTLLDKLFLPQPAANLVRGLRGEFDARAGESVGIVETHTVASALLAADSALKRAEVWLRRLHLARGIGGKGYFTLTGPLHMVQAALEGAAAAIEAPLLLAAELIERPHPELEGPVF